MTRKFLIDTDTASDDAVALVMAAAAPDVHIEAVTVVAGNVPRSPRSVLDPAYPLPALIANNYGEMMSIPLYDSALLLAALVLLVVVILFNVFSRLVLARVERSIR